MKNELQKKYEQSRGNLLLIIVFTIINIALLFSQSGTMFLFSITVPYWAVAFAYYLELTYLYIVAGVVVALYLIFWFFSKKHYGWFIPALILFILDTIYLGYVSIDMAESSNIIDILVHIWVLYYLGAGIYFGYKLKHLPAEETIAPEAAAETDPEAASATAESENSAPIRPAE
ncbi:MAG: hypothetical protein IJ435_07705 [Clostridia bacterium]|nr:hypothetical protein [Clostridia bacterium]